MLCLSDFVKEVSQHLPTVVGHAHTINFEWFEHDYDVAVVSSEAWADYEKRFDIVESVKIEVDEDCFQVYRCDATGKTLFSGNVVVAIVNKTPTIEITWDGRFVRATGFPVVE